MELQPIFARVLLERPYEEVSKGGVILVNPKNNLEKCGIVRAIGNGCDEFMKQLIGKRVMFARFAGDWLKIPGSDKEYYICQEEDILGVLNEESENDAGE